MKAILRFKKKLLPIYSVIVIIIVIFLLSYNFKPSYIKQFFNSITATSEISHGDTSKKQVIFTFDGGSGAQSGDKILATLAKHHVRGSFFLTGKFVEENPDLVKHMVAQGHEIFNHTYNHPHLPTLKDNDIVEELEKMEKSLMTVAGISPKPYFRAPYGDRNSRVLDIAAKAGYRSVYWMTDALDWQESSGKTANQVGKLILSHIAPGAIYLMHLGDSITGNILDDVFTKIEARGYTPVSLIQGL